MFNKIYEKIKLFIKENIKFLISLVFIIIIFTYELPYCIYTPGGKVDLSKRIEVESGYDYDGEISMAYVSMVKSSLPFIVLSYIIPNWDLQKQSDVSYDNFTLDETLEIDKIYMQEGINNAILSAYKLAGKQVTVKGNKLKVVYLEENSKSNLKINDEILSVDNTKVSSVDEIRDVLKNKNDKDKVMVKIIRKGKIKEINSTLTLINNEPKLGIATVSLLDLKTNPKVEVKTKSSESGSSGGLMMSLAIYNSLVKEDITKKDLIMGTGTIDSSGKVGKIDGVKYKLLGATKKKADVFLCPKENYKEAVKVKKDNDLNIEIKSVETLQEAIEYLESR